jgi:hypothetical protein
LSACTKKGAAREAIRSYCGAAAAWAEVSARSQGKSWRNRDKCRRERGLSHVKFLLNTKNCTNLSQVVLKNFVIGHWSLVADRKIHPRDRNVRPPADRNVGPPPPTEPPTIRLRGWFRRASAAVGCGCGGFGPPKDQKRKMAQNGSKWFRAGGLGRRGV